MQQVQELNTLCCTQITRYVVVHYAYREDPFNTRGPIPCSSLWRSACRASTGHVSSPAGTV